MRAERIVLLQGDEISEPDRRQRDDAIVASVEIAPSTSVRRRGRKSVISL